MLLSKWPLLWWKLCCLNYRSDLTSILFVLDDIWLLWWVYLSLKGSPEFNYLWASTIWLIRFFCFIRCSKFLYLSIRLFSSSLCSVSFRQSAATFELSWSWLSLSGQTKIRLPSSDWFSPKCQQSDRLTLWFKTGFPINAPQPGY